MALGDGKSSEEQYEVPHSGPQETASVASTHPLGLYRAGLLLAGCPDFRGTPNFRPLHKHSEIAPPLPKTLIRTTKSTILKTTMLKGTHAFKLGKVNTVPFTPNPPLDGTSELT